MAGKLAVPDWYPRVTGETPDTLHDREAANRMFAQEHEARGMDDETTTAPDNADDPLVGRAVRLFTFLGEAQRLRNTSVVDLETYRREGAVLWLADAPAHPAVGGGVRHTHVEGDPAVLTLDRVPAVAAPEPDTALAGWLDVSPVDPRREPVLREYRSLEVDDDHGGTTRRRVERSERPEIDEAFAAYLPHWRAWAEQELRDQPARDYYNELFSIHVAAAGHPEELELVLGTSLLTWVVPAGNRVRRHLLTTAVRIEFDEDTGRLALLADDTVEGSTLELDMLDPGLIGQPRLVNELRDRARETEAHPLDRERMGELGRRVTHQLAADAQYRDADDQTVAAATPVTSFAPALLLRKRSQKGLLEIFRRIVEQLRESGEVPDGIRPLVDADHEPLGTVGSLDGAGAVVHVEEDPFLPLPVNDRQLQILRRVDTTAQTLIQGPPGTGKTHTAAVLITHLLAQGKRILVTAHTDRALKEVREKLPEAIQPLAVAVVGSSREDMSDLRVAVERIAATASEHDAGDAAHSIRRHLDGIDDLRRLRAELGHRLQSAREREVVEVDLDGYRGSPAAIAREVRAGDERHGWLAELVDAPSGRAPLSAVELAAWRGHLRDTELVADEPEAGHRLVPLDALPDAAAFAALVHAERQARGVADSYAPLRTDAVYAPASALDAETRRLLADRIGVLLRDTRELLGGHEAWIAEAATDLTRGRGSVWEGRHSELGRLIDQADRLVSDLGPATTVTVQGDDIGLLVPGAHGVGAHLDAGNTIKLGADGLPKQGLLTPRAVKTAESFFARVRVNGLAPTTAPQVRAFLLWVEANHVLDALDRAWPASVVIPPEDTPAERLEWHRAEAESLGRLLGLDARLVAEDGRVAALDLPRPAWLNPGSVERYLAVLTAVQTAEEAASATARIDHAVSALVDAERESDAAPVLSNLLRATRSRDDRAYAAAHQRLARLWDVRELLRHRDELGSRLAGAPGLAAAVASTPDSHVWDERIPEIEDGWRHAVASSWLSSQDAADVNALQREILVVDERIRGHVTELSAIRAWDHAVAPGRLTRGSRASLEQYAALVKRLGKGTGTYAAQRRREIRSAMDRCRPAVPVWIMPLYRIADQFDVQPDMFDVVIVDEASQAGIEASFLQYLAPKIVVIGDDRQVSPSAVGVDQQELRDLGSQYLFDDQFRSTWQDPQRSLFDEAKMRFSGMITLVEHRRCVPEIIGFSNRIAYEPDGVRLIPVRQFGADRLEPVKPVFVPGGYEKGSSSTRTNPAEVDAIVAQVEKCIADPAYDGRTIGVISLLGTGQAKAIEKALLDRITPEEWAARDLRCGDAADFQGSERDVVFLSMVAAPGPERRLTALTQTMYVQRYNVAASRAKDQLWVFHSVDRATLTNPEDMRYQLLDYCYGIAARGVGEHEGATTGLVPEDMPVAPFGSLFEQRVHNRIASRGYTLIPQFESLGYSIDIVAVGPTRRLAIECDGDFWHGPEAYQRDMGRQRELERCGWRFHRILESEFYRDPVAALEPLWATLAELDIHPAGWMTAGPTDEPADVYDESDSEAVTPAFGLPMVQPLVSETVSSLPTDLPEPAPLTTESTASARLVSSPVVPTPGVSGPAVDELIPSDPVAVGSPVPMGAVVEPGPVGGSGTPQTVEIGYEEFTGSTVPAQGASSRELVDGLVAVVAVEGPVVGARLHTAYVHGANGQRVGSLITKALNSALSTALRQGRLVKDAPLGEAGHKHATFRLPDQPEVRVRPRGVRYFDQIPPAELAAVMAEEAAGLGWSDPLAVYRATAARFDVRQVGSVIRARLDQVAPLVRDAESGGHGSG
ncbi:AAA domain-containing protein [Pseudonocardia alni]|uniref:AAA domain-containing protein n=1 Tax=Pseudonocardia alni TaxID=33907 RepID=UPI00332E2750